MLLNQTDVLEMLTLGPFFNPFYRNISQTINNQGIPLTNNLRVHAPTYKTFVGTSLDQKSSW